MTLWAIVPELILAGACLVLVPAAAWVRGRWVWLPLGVAAAALVACCIALLSMLGWSPVPAFDGIYAVDGLATAFKLVIAASAIVVLVLFGAHYRQHARRANAPVALLFATLGALGLASSNDLVLIVLFLQMMSMAGYVLIALVREDGRALEAVLKYFVYAAVALAVMAYGLTFLYGMTGSLALGDIGRALAGGDRVWVAVALVLVLVGFGFEIALVPVHVWAPDTFSGASAPVAGFLSVVPKVAALAALIRFMSVALPGELVAWPSIIAGLAVASMTVGNLVALRQTALKRLLAWSSIAHAGYVLAAVAVVASHGLAPVAVAFYLATYAFMNLGAFAVVAQLERSAGSDAIEGVRGLHWRNPGVAAVLTLALLSLAGIPPLAGFAGKVVVFTALFEGGMAWLAAIAAVNMVIGLAYYVRVVAAMYLRAPDGRPSLARTSGYAPSYALCVAAIVALGVLPQLGLAALASAWQLLP